MTVCKNIACGDFFMHKVTRGNWGHNALMKPNSCCKGFTSKMIWWFLVFVLTWSCFHSDLILTSNPLTHGVDSISIALGLDNGSLPYSPIGICLDSIQGCCSHSNLLNSHWPFYHVHPPHRLCFRYTVIDCSPPFIHKSMKRDHCWSDLL